MQFESKVETRLQILDTYKKFLDTSQNKVNSFLDQIGWNAEDTFSERKSCRQSKTKVTKSNTKTSNQQKIYPDVWIPESAKSYIKLGTKDINKIINKDTNNQRVERTPQSLEEYQSAFSKSDRLMVYDYVLKNTKFEKSSDVNLNFSLANDSNTSANENSALLDGLALKRDLKRRRAKYRKPASRGYKQELKDTIETQMEMYMNYLEKKFGIVNPNAENSQNQDVIKKVDQEESTAQYEYFTEEHMFKETLKRRKDRQCNEPNRSRVHEALRDNKLFNSKDSRFNESVYFFHAHNRNFVSHRPSSDKAHSLGHNYSSGDMERSSHNEESEKSDDHKRTSYSEMPNKSGDHKSINSSRRRYYSSDNKSIESYNEKHKRMSDHKRKKHKRDNYEHSDSDDHKKHKKT